jgi:undecaprenyl-diphosphatase
MEPILEALVMGLVQGLTEFLPISSSGHLIVVPELLGWRDPFIDSLVFSVMLHLGTLAALLVYFRADWLRLVPAGLASLRDRSFRGDSDRKLAWLILASTVPAVLAGLLLEDAAATAFREARLVAVTLVLGGALLWLGDRVGARTRTISAITFPIAIGIGAAQAVALVPGISRSGITIAAGLLAGLTREGAARFSFLMATPIIAAAGARETLNLLTAAGPVDTEVAALAVGVAAAFLSGLAAIAGLLRFLRTNSVTVFVVYRIFLALVIAAWWLGVPR